MYPRYMYLPTLAKVSTCLGRYLPIGTLLNIGSLRTEAGTSPIPMKYLYPSPYRLSTNPEKVHPSIFYLTLLRKPERNFFSKKANLVLSILKTPNRIPFFS